MCSDGARAILGSKSGIVAGVKTVTPWVTVTHYMIHRQGLAPRTLPRELQAILDNAIKVVCYIKSMPVNTRLFRELCKDLDSEHQVLLFYTKFTDSEHQVLLFFTKVRCLSQGIILNRIFDLREELKIFLDMQDNEIIFFSVTHFGNHV